MKRLFFMAHLLRLYYCFLKRQPDGGILVTIICITLFIILCKYKGSADIVDSIYNSWDNILPNGELRESNYNSIGALGWETEKTMKSHLRYNFTSIEFGKITHWDAAKGIYGVIATINNFGQLT